MIREKPARDGLPKLNVGFESRLLSYSDLPVDLYNSGINQLLGVAAARGHRTYHFSVADLYEHDGVAYAATSVTALPEGWRGDPLEAYRDLQKVDEQTVRVADIHLCFARADDVRNLDTPNLEILRQFEESGMLLESIAATLATCDKYEIVRRCPEVPQPLTFSADTADEALAAIEQLPRESGWFVVKDRFGYGCGEQVHRLHFEQEDLPGLLHDYLSAYESIIIQEFCPEVAEGDIAAIFWDDRLVAAIRRTPEKDQWKTNASLGATEWPHELTPEQEATARAVREAFPEIRLTAVDVLPSGRAIEINAFPGGRGLLQAHDIELGTLVFGALERAAREKLEGPALPPVPVGGDEAPALAGARAEIEPLYDAFPEPLRVFDVFSSEQYDLAMKDIIEFVPKSDDYILSLPHAGMFVVDRFANYFTLGEEALLEIDLFSDIVFEGLDGLQVVCRFAPFFVDMNRRREGGAGEKELPGHLTNPPHKYYTIKNELLLEKGYTAEEEAEILRYYDLYHDVTETLIDRMKRERGYALVIDGHSMTSVGLGRVYDEGQPRDNFVVGTLGGTSADDAIIDRFVGSLTESAKPYGLGLSIARDRPYSGGFITRRHHAPEEDVHVLQIEVTMDTYMYEATESNPALRYALKPHRVRMVQQILETAIAAASEAAKERYS